MENPTEVERPSRENNDFPPWVIVTSQAIITRYGEDVQDVECLSASLGFEYE